MLDFSSTADLVIKVANSSVIVLGLRGTREG
jgi:hypothetical protein